MIITHLSPYAKQIAGGLAGILVAYGVYAGVQYFTQTRAGVTETETVTTSELTQEGILFPEPVSKGERIALRVERALNAAAPSRRLPPAAFERGVVAAPVERVREPQQLHLERERMQMEEFAPVALTDSGLPLLGLIAMTAVVSVGWYRRRPRDHVC